MTDYLQFVAEKFNIYQPVLPIIGSGLRKSSSHRIIDIGSGSGGGIVSIYRHLKEEFEDLEIILTDLYPNVQAFKEISKQTNGQVGYIDTPIDATSVPTDLVGFRLQLLSFHHFEPETAQRILQDAVNANAVIGIFEAHERKSVYLISMLFSPLMVLIFTPFIKPFKLSRLLFTYLIPIIPVCVLWDGLVSVLRTYTTAEMGNMIEQIDQGKYVWEMGKVPEGSTNGILYFLGYRQQSES